MIVLIGQTKGGVGKSALAANLAVMLVRKELSVLLVDADKQQSNTKWGSVRTMEGHHPPIIVASAQAQEANARDFRDKIISLTERFDYIVIDCGGHDSRELRASLTIADILIAPVAPSIVDLWALKDFDEIVGQLLPANSRLKAYVVINKAPSLNFYNQRAQAQEALHGLINLKFSGVSITDRPRIQDYYQNGQGVFDIDGSDTSLVKAQSEMEKLYNLVSDNE